MRYSRSECLGWPNPTGPPLPGMDRLWLCALLFIAQLNLSLGLLEEGLVDGNLFPLKRNIAPSHVCIFSYSFYSTASASNPLLIPVYPGWKITAV